MPNLTLYKTIFQARYKPTLRFYDLLNSAAQQLENEYPYWLTTRLKVVFKDYEKHCSLNIGHNALAYEQDSADVKMEAHVKTKCKQPVVRETRWSDL